MTFKITCGFGVLSLMQTEITLSFLPSDNPIMYSVTDKFVPEQISPQLDYSIAETFVSNNTACLIS